MILLDTDVIIDIYRGEQKTIEWFESLPENPSLPGYVVLELMNGCRDRREMNRVESLVEHFELCWPSPVDYERAISTFGQCYLAHRTGPIDILIGQLAAGKKAVLYTFNAKHFKHIPNLKVESPYIK